MFKLEKQRLFVFFVFFILHTLWFASFTIAQDEVANEKIIERYKLMLYQKPKEGRTFDRLYLLYLENAGLAEMVKYYKEEVRTKPDDPDVHLILGHIYKRFGKDIEAVETYQRAVELAPNDYYTHFALGQMYTTLRQDKKAITELTQAAALLEQVQTAPPEELIGIYKVLGQAYFRQDKVDDAIQAWGKISELNPQNIFARIELAALYREKGLYLQAVAEHQSIIEIKKDDPYRVCLSHRKIGNIQVEKGDLQEAIQSYDAALALTTQGNWLRKDLQNRIIAIYANNANWKDLISYYQEKLKATPKEPALHGLLAAAYIENQQLEEGIAAYRKGLELAPTDINLRLNLITTLRNADKFKEAVVEYEILSEQQPDNFGSYRELGKLYIVLENEDKARTTYQKMIDYDPENASTYITLAEIYTSHKWNNEAAAAYEKAISLAPDNLDYIRYFGEFYFRQGNHEKAVETWNRMVADDKGIAENYDQLARLLSSKRLHTEAINASRKAAELMPDAYRYREALAKRLMENNAYDEALAEYTEAAKLAPNEFFVEQIDDRRIEIYRKQGTLMDKVEAMEIALQKQNLTPAETFANHKRLGKMYLKLGNTTHAREVLLSAKTLQPDNVVINRWLADIYNKQGHRSKAIAIYTHLTQVDNTNAREYYANIARSYLNVMDFAAATDAAKQVVAHSPRNPEGYQLLAEIAKESRDYETSIDSLRQAARLRPDAVDIRKKLAKTFKLSGKPQQAIAQYWRCWELSSNVEDKLNLIKPLSEIYYELGKRSEFEEKLKQMAKVNTTDIDPILTLVEFYRMEGELTKARFQLALALDREDDNPDLLERLVRICLDLGDIADALAYQQQLVETHPDPINYQKLGELLFDAGREEEAIQAWENLLHIKNHTFETELKLTTYLFQRGMSDKALSVLDNAAEKAKDIISIFQVGSVFAAMYEFDRAQKYLLRTLEMPIPITTQQTLTQRSTGNAVYIKTGPLGININKFNLAKNLYWEIDRGVWFLSKGEPLWKPKSFEEAHAGAIVLLRDIAESQGKLPELIQQLETKTTANPKDIQPLETLAHFYTFIRDSEKVNDVIDRLIATEPDNPTYQAIRMNHAIQTNQDSDSLARYMNDVTNLPPEIRFWYIVQYAGMLSREGRKTDAQKLVEKLKNEKITNLNTGPTLIKTLAEIEAVDRAQNILDQLPIPSGLPNIYSQRSWQISPIEQQWQLYLNGYQSLTTAYIALGQIDKAIALFWQYLEYSKPNITTSQNVATISYSPYSYGRYAQIKSNYTSPTIYFNKNRLKYLQQIFSQLWMKNQKQMLYTSFQTKLESTKGRERIYPALALSYCYWWEGNRDKSSEILYALQKEFPNDLTLKLNTVFLSIQTHQYATALELLEECAADDPRNRARYHQLMLQLALHTGNIETVRQLTLKKLNSGAGSRELYQFSRQLQNAGLTKYAIAVAKKAMNLALQENYPTYLTEFAQYLKDLGQHQDAAFLAKRALLLANRSDRERRSFEQHSYEFQRALYIAKRPEILKKRQATLVQAAQKNPDSFQAQVRLAEFYERSQHFKKSSEAYKVALTLKPEDSVTRKRYANMLQESEQYKKASTQYAILLKENPDVFRTYYWSLISAFIEAEKVDELVGLIKEMLRTKQDTLTAKQNIGLNLARKIVERYADRAKYHQKAAEIVIEMSEKIVAIDPSDIDTYLKLASMYSHIKEHDKAIQLLRQKLDTVNNISIQEQLILKLVELYKTTGNLEVFVKEYDEKFDENPTDTFLLYLVTFMKITMNDIESAEPLINLITDNVPSQTPYKWIRNLANTCQTTNNYNLELKLLKAAAAQVNPHDSSNIQSIYDAIALAYNNNGEIKQAQEIFRKIGNIQIMQGGENLSEKERVARKYKSFKMWDDAEVLFTDIRDNLSVHFHTRKKAQEALQEIQKERGKSVETPEETPNLDIGTLRALAQQYMNSSYQLNEAIQAYEQITKAVPEDLESKANLATLYSRQDQHSKAVELWNSLLENDPTNTKYQDGLVNSYQVVGKYSKALELAQKYIEKEPESAVHYIRLAKLYIAKNQIEDAIIIYKKVIEFAPENVEIYPKLLSFYLGKNDIENAEKTYEQAIQYTSTDWILGGLASQMVGTYYEQGKLEEFIKQQETKGLLTFSIQRNLAFKYRNSGNYEKAVSAFHKALDMAVRDSERKEISQELQWIYRELDSKADNLLKAMPSLNLNTNLTMAEFYRKYDVPERAKRHIQKAGFIPEDLWLILGPFDNTNGIGYDKTYIPENAMQLNTTEKYDGINGSVTWVMTKDETFDGYVEFGIDSSWLTNYAWTTLTSRGEREAQIRFGNGCPAKVWLNGKEVFVNTETLGAEIDEHIISVPLKSGKNSILVKVCNEEKRAGFYFRLTDMNGKPFDDLEFLDPEEN
ncbi:hypothetical protein C6501_15175 [Candidatus Poribacteria bacterium]|nr:MAG: hypothetical protein C6501_15175 [Candidatus Poribacteria bacterium]